MLVKNLLTLLVKHQIKPNKTLGQNFLIDKNILDKIIAAANLNKNDTVLEVGPGIGVLTQGLAKKAGKVIAIEKDAKMVKILQETLADFENVEIIEGDALEVIKLSSYKVYKVVANIPYYLTSHLIRIFLEAKNPPTEIVLLIQKEVAQRICAKPPKMSLLAVSVQFYADPKIISYVSKNCFFPAPKVDSAILKMQLASRNSESEYSNSEFLIPNFFKIVKAGFSHPRKQLSGNLSKELKLEKEKVEKWLLQNNISPSCRAETLQVDDWEKLALSPCRNNLDELK